MKESSKRFLFDLLSTPSPSGAEEKIQEKWLSYVEPYADQLKTDNAGNAIAVLNPDARYKVLLAGHCDEIGFLIKAIDDNGFLFVEKLGGISQKPALGMRVTIYGSGGTIHGVFGTNAEHHGGAKDKLTFDDLFIDCGAESREEMEKYVAIGDTAVYDVMPKNLLGEQYLSARGLDNRSGAFITAEVLRRLAKKRPDIGVYAVSTVNEETNMGGAYFAGAGIEPDMALALDVTFATDYPGVDQKKNGKIKLGGGPVLAKGAPINRVMNEKLEAAAAARHIPLQYELTPRMTGTDADRLRLTGRGVPVSLVSLPLRYMHAPAEVVSFKDIESEIDLLSSFISQLTQNENVKPVNWPLT